MTLCLCQFPMTALREIRILQLLNHENVIDLVEVCRSKGEGVWTRRGPHSPLSSSLCSHPIQQRAGQHLPRV